MSKLITFFYLSLLSLGLLDQPAVQVYNTLQYIKYAISSNLNMVLNHKNQWFWQEHYHTVFEFNQCKIEIDDSV